MSLIRRSVDLPRPPDAVWAALFAERSLVGLDGLQDRIGAEGRAQDAAFRVLDVEPGRRVVLGWRDRAAESTVEILLAPCEGGTQLAIVHRGVPPHTFPALQRRWDDVVRGMAPRPGWARWAALAAAVLAAAAVGWWVRSEPDPAPEAAPAPAPVVVGSPPPRPAPSAPAVPAAGHASAPSWARDGSFLAWEVGAAGGATLVVARVRDGELRAPRRIDLPGGGAAQVGEASHMREGYLLFRGSIEGGAGRIWYVPLAGGQPAELMPVSSQPGDLSFPRVSADGGAVVFVAGASLHVRDTATSAVRVLVEPTDGPVSWPAWSPDGARVVYQVGSGPGADVWEVSLDDGAARRVADGPGAQERPVVTADGAVWAFAQAPTGGPTDLVRLAPDPATVVAGVQLPLGAAPAVSDDGAWLAVVPDDPAEDDLVWLVRAADGEVIPVRTGLSRVGDPAVTIRDGEVVLAVTHLPPGAEWRTVAVVHPPPGPFGRR